MKNKIPRPTVFIFTIFIVLLLSSPTVPASGDVANKYIILYDISHGQNFTLANLTGAVDSLKIIENKYNTQIEIKEFNSSFTSTNLQGADLLIISNPSGNSTTSDTERNALTNFIADGGNILYLGNPLANDGNITGHPKLLNDFMNERYNNFGAFHVANSLKEDSPTVLIDELNNDGNDSHIVISNNTINEAAIRNGVMEFNDVLFYGSGLRDTYTGTKSSYSNYVKGNVSYSTFFIGDTYNPNFNSIQWILGRQMKSALGRTMSIGSTIMFSDLPYSSNQTWFETRGNKALFVNMIAWLLQITPQQDIVPIAENGVTVYAWIGYVMLITFAVFGLVFGYNILTKRIEVSNIFNVKKPRIKYQKKSSSSPVKKKKKKKARS